MHRNQRMNSVLVHSKIQDRQSDAAESFPSQTVMFGQRTTDNVALFYVIFFGVVVCICSSRIIVSVTGK